jgi:hypothetical protein
MTVLPSNSSPDTNSEMNLLHTFLDSMRFIPCPEVKVMDSEHTRMWNVLHLPTECYIKRAHSHCVDVVAICRIASIEDSNLGTDVCSMRSTVDSVITVKFFKIPWLGWSQFLCNIVWALSMILIPRLQLWHRHWLVSIWSVGDLHSCLLEMLYFCSIETF